METAGPESRSEPVQRGNRLLICGPTERGIDILVRYVTRANNRYEVKNRLYQRVIELLHKPMTPAAPTAS